MVFCHNCGTRCDQPSAKFCFSCGTTLVTGSAAAPAPAPVHHSPPSVVHQPAPAPVTVGSPIQQKEKGRCQSSTKDKSTLAYVCYNCGYGSHGETDCVVCGGYMRGNQKEAKLCMDCGWSLWPENCAHCNQPLGTTKIKGHVCQDCSSGPHLNKCCKLRPAS